MTNEKSITAQRLYVPASLADGKLLEAAGLKRKVWDKYFFLLHTMYLKRILSGAERYEAVEINAQLFEKHVSTKNAATIKDFWINQGVITTNGSYEAGVRSKAYVFTPAYRDEKCIDLGYYDELFEKKVYAMRQKTRHGKIDLSIRHHAHLNYCLEEIRIDALGAQLALNQKLHDFTGTAAAKLDLLDKINLSTVAIKNIYDQEFHISRDVKGRRVHTNLTNLIKDARSWMYLETGEALVNLDIPNSQPLFLALLLLDHYGKDVPKDVLDYVSLCESGTLYQHLMEKMGLRYEIAAEKKMFKARLFKAVFYGKNEVADRYVEWQDFKEEFPNVASFITEQKRVDYKQLSIRMQRAESDLILDNVVATIAHNYRPSEFWVATIHDSIVCTQDNAEYVQGLMVNAFKAKWLNVKINPEPL